MEGDLKSILDDYVKKGLVMVNKHPDADLYIYNYSQKVQYEKLWDEITLQCRGLIMDGSGNIVSRPFKKFFNYEELVQKEGFEFPKGNFHIQDKMDGSLGITYWIGDECFIATRGSFTSEQSVYANNLLQTLYKDALSGLQKDLTYLFEIIYPDNRIVVDYMGESNLTHLATIETKTGKELFPESIGIPFVETYGNQSAANELPRVHRLQNQIPYNNKEGVVITFDNGFKCKIKHPEYVRLHRIMTNMTPKSIWESMRDGDDILKVIEDTPDEFHKEISDIVEDLTDKFNDIREEYQAIVDKTAHMFGSRKEMAIFAQDLKHPAVYFAIADGKPADHIIWKLIKPK